VSPTKNRYTTTWGLDPTTIAGALGFIWNV